MNRFVTGIVLVLSALLGGCAAGNRIDYRESVPTISLPSPVEKKGIEVLVVDQRPYVISGNKKPNFVGVMRALAYVPYNITTASGFDLSSDIEQATMSALGGHYLTARAVLPSANEASSPDHLLLRMTLRDWKNDVYMRARFDYDVTAEVIDHNGTVLASKSAQHRGAINHVIVAGTSVLQEVLGDDRVVSALTGRLAIEPPDTTPAAHTAAPQGARPTYDECMRRVLKITDKQLRLQSMSACDAAIQNEGTRL